jgi:hypothetical protein
MSFTIHKFNTGPAWMNVVWDYERNVLKGKSYPKEKTLSAQRKKLYKFTLEPDHNHITFESEKDYIWFILKWG